MINFIGWAIGILSFFFALAGFEKAFFSGFLFLIAGVFAFPPIYSRVSLKFTDSIKSFRWLIFSIAFIFGIYNFATIANSEVDSLKESNPDLYLEKIKGNNEKYMAELKELKPELYEAEASKLRIAKEDAQNKIDAIKKNEELVLLRKDYKNNPQNYLNIESFKSTAEGFGTVLVVDFNIKNSAPVSYKDIKVECSQIAKSGTELAKDTEVIYDLIKPDELKLFKKISLGFINQQTTEIKCRVIDGELI